MWTQKKWIELSFFLEQRNSLNLNNFLECGWWKNINKTEINCPRTKGRLSWRCTIVLSQPPRQKRIGNLVRSRRCSDTKPDKTLPAVGNVAKKVRPSAHSCLLKADWEQFYKTTTTIYILLIHLRELLSCQTLQLPSPSTFPFSTRKLPKKEEME